MCFLLNMYNITLKNKDNFCLCGGDNLYSVKFLKQSQNDYNVGQNR